MIKSCKNVFYVAAIALLLIAEPATAQGIGNGGAGKGVNANALNKQFRDLMRDSRWGGWSKRAANSSGADVKAVNKQVDEALRQWHPGESTQWDRDKYSLPTFPKGWRKLVFSTHYEDNKKCERCSHLFEAFQRARLRLVRIVEAYEARDGVVSLDNTAEIARLDAKTKSLSLLKAGLVENGVTLYFLKHKPIPDSIRKGAHDLAQRIRGYAKQTPAIEERAAIRKSLDDFLYYLNAYRKCHCPADGMIVNITLDEAAAKSDTTELTEGAECAVCKKIKTRIDLYSFRIDAQQKKLKALKARLTGDASKDKEIEAQIADIEASLKTLTRVRFQIASEDTRCSGQCRVVEKFVEPKNYSTIEGNTTVSAVEYSSHCLKCRDRLQALQTWATTYNGIVEHYVELQAKFYKQSEWDSSDCAATADADFRKVTSSSAFEVAQKYRKQAGTLPAKIIELEATLAAFKTAYKEDFGRSLDGWEAEWHLRKLGWRTIGSGYYNYYAGNSVCFAKTKNAKSHLWRDPVFESVNDKDLEQLVKTGHLIVPESYNPTSIRFAAYDEFLWRYEQYIGRAWRELRRARSKMTYYDSLHEEMHTLERRMSELKKQQTTLEEALRACETIYCADTSETEKTEPRERVVSVPRDRTKTEPADQTEAKPTDQTESKPDPFLEDADLSIEKKLKGPCYRGGTCRYDIVITNNGPGNYSGVLSFTDTPTLRPGWITIPSGNGACARDRGGASFTCTSNPVTLLPGHHWTTRLAIKLPRTNKRGVKNCAEVRDLDAVGPLDRDSGLVAAVQTALKRAGFNPGPADGQLGRKTRDALRQFQTSNGLGSESPGSKKVLDALLHINGRQADPNPQNNVSCVRTDFTQPFYDTSAPRKRPRRRKTEKGIDLSPALEIGIGIGMQMLRGRHHDSEGPPKD